MSSKKASKQEDSKNEKQLAFVSKADGVDRSENLEALKKGGWLRAQLDKKRTLKDKKKWLESMGILLLEASATHKMHCAETAIDASSTNKGLSRSCGHQTEKR